MLAAILRLILAFLAFRFIAGVFRSRHRPSDSTPRGPRDAGRTEPKGRPYGDLTPYDIEDAEYEDLPGKES